MHKTYFPKYGNYQEARKHALKLAFWPGVDDPAQGLVVDLDWDWIRALRSQNVAELRIRDNIGGNRNLRVIFWLPGAPLSGDPVDSKGNQMKRIWTIAVVNKKSKRLKKP